MAQRAAERRVVDEAEWTCRDEAEFQARRMTVDEYVASIDLTAEDAAEIVAEGPKACACAGPPEEISREPEQPCRCRLLWMRIDQLLLD